MLSDNLHLIVLQGYLHLDAVLSLYLLSSGSKEISEVYFDPTNDKL